MGCTIERTQPRQHQHNVQQQIWLQNKSKLEKNEVYWEQQEQQYEKSLKKINGRFEYVCPQQNIILY